MHCKTIYCSLPFQLQVVFHCQVLEGLMCLLLRSRHLLGSHHIHLCGTSVILYKSLSAVVAAHIEKLSALYNIDANIQQHS